MFISSPSTIKQFLLISLTICKIVILLTSKSSFNVSTIHWLSLLSDLASGRDPPGIYSYPKMPPGNPRQDQIWHILPVPFRSILSCLLQSGHLLFCPVLTSSLFLASSFFFFLPNRSALSCFLVAVDLLH